MPREDEQKKAHPAAGEKEPSAKKQKPEVADEKRESSKPEPSDHKGTEGDVYGR